MSYFLCLTVPPIAAGMVHAAFDARVYQTKADKLPIAATTRGKNDTWTSVLLQMGSSSASLIGKGLEKRTRRTDQTALLISGVETLLANEDCKYVLFLAHWYKGYLTEETVPLQGEITLDMSALTEMFSESKKSIFDELKEDVRYKIYRQIPTPF